MRILPFCIVSDRYKLNCQYLNLNRIVIFSIWAELMMAAIELISYLLFVCLCPVSYVCSVSLLMRLSLNHGFVSSCTHLSAEKLRLYTSNGWDEILFVAPFINREITLTLFTPIDWDVMSFHINYEKVSLVHFEERRDPSPTYRSLRNWIYIFLTLGMVAFSQPISSHLKFMALQLVLWASNTPVLKHSRRTKI